MIDYPTNSDIIMLCVWLAIAVIGLSVMLIRHNRTNQYVSEDCISKYR